MICSSELTHSATMMMMTTIERPTTMMPLTGDGIFNAYHLSMHVDSDAILALNAKPMKKKFNMSISLLAATINFNKMHSLVLDKLHSLCKRKTKWEMESREGVNETETKERLSDSQNESVVRLCLSMQYHVCITNWLWHFDHLINWSKRDTTHS